jgi:hypothetical protein
VRVVEDQLGQPGGADVRSGRVEDSLTVVSELRVIAVESIEY